MHEKKGTYLVFNGFTSAFDKVHHEKLRLRLISLDAFRILWNYIIKVYSQFYNRIKRNGELSEISPPKMDARQGDPCSAILFLLFIDSSTEYQSIKSR